MREDCPYGATPYLDPDGKGGRPVPEAAQPVDAGGQAQCPVCGALYKEGERPICHGTKGDAPT